MIDSLVHGEGCIGLSVPPNGRHGPRGVASTSGGNSSKIHRTGHANGSCLPRLAVEAHLAVAIFKMTRSLAVSVGVVGARLHLGSTNSVRVASLGSELARGGSSDVGITALGAWDAGKVVNVAVGIVPEGAGSLVAVRLGHCEGFCLEARRGDKEGGVDGDKVNLSNQEG